MATDAPVPLATTALMVEGPFSSLVSGYSAPALTNLMAKATRACETEVHRRLAPFSITETHRAEGIDPDEYTDAANLPMDLQGTLGRSYAYALGASSLVRHCWLNEYATLYPEFWSYSNISVTIFRSYGGSQNVNSATQIIGPEVDSGHMWFQLGMFIPVGSLFRVGYSGGYTTVPMDLVEACMYMAASIAVTELDPQDSEHDPEQLHTKALMRLSPYLRA